MAGTIRTMTGKALDQRGPSTGFTPERIRELLAMEILGPLPRTRDGLLLPTPTDLVWRDGDDERVFPAYPGTGRDGVTVLPEGLERLPNVEIGDSNFKPGKPGAWVTQAWMTKWLTEDYAGVEPLSIASREAAELEARPHVQIEDSRGGAKDEMLFHTSGIRLHGDVAMSVRVSGSTEAQTEIVSGFSEFHPLGGERRLAWFESQGGTDAAWECPGRVGTALTEGAGNVRLVLATPGLFDSGWIPGWLKRGELVPGSAGLRLRLVSACVERWIAVSGWSYERGKTGPKAVRRLVPSGAVYFCRVESGSAAEAAALWLKPVADVAQDRRDGYGLALWGTWSERNG